MNIDVPALVAEVERLRREVAMLKQTLRGKELERAKHRTNAVDVVRLRAENLALRSEVERLRANGEESYDIIGAKAAFGIVDALRGQWMPVSTVGRPMRRARAMNAVAGALGPLSTRFIGRTSAGRRMTRRTS